MKAIQIIESVKNNSLVKDFIHKSFPMKDGGEYKSFKILYQPELPLRGEFDLVFSKRDAKPYVKKSTKRVDLSAFVQISDRKYAGFYPLFGFEVKISLSDLKNDKKFHRYLPYFDYFLFAVPELMEQETLSYLSFMDNIGLVSVNEKGEAKLVKTPKQVEINPLKKYQVLESFLVREL